MQQQDITDAKRHLLELLADGLVLTRHCHERHRVSAATPEVCPGAIHQRRTESHNGLGKAGVLPLQAVDAMPHLLGKVQAVFLD